MSGPRKSGRSSRKAHEATVECDGVDMFVVFDGTRIAKRGHPGTPQAMTWIPLEPGFAVYSSADHSEITIEHNGVRVQ